MLIISVHNITPFYFPQQCFGLSQGVDKPQQVPELPADSRPEELTLNDELNIRSSPSAPHALHKTGALSLDFTSSSSLCPHFGHLYS